MQTLATDEVGKSYRGRRVVNGVSLHINQSEVIGLLGPNGAGKTTTFYMIVGLVPPDAGRILVDGSEITRVPMYLRARNYGISYLPQEPSVFRKLSVEDNILAVLEAQRHRGHDRRSADARPRTRRGTGATARVPGPIDRSLRPRAGAHQARGSGQRRAVRPAARAAHARRRAGGAARGVAR